MIIEKDGKVLSLQDFVKLTGAPFVSPLLFSEPAILNDIQERYTKLLKKGELTREQMWFGAYFKKEIEEQPLPKVSIRWINPTVGWGVFAERDFNKMHFIAEYGGTVRRKRSSDDKNAYCFEYVVAQGHATPYNIDAEVQGGLARYINHSDRPNLQSTLATFEGISHVILIVKEPVKAGEQLCYDYGDDYWRHRPKPQTFSTSR